MCVLTGEGRSVPSGHGLRLCRLDQPSRIAVDHPVTAERLVGCFRGVSSGGMRKPFLTRGEVLLSPVHLDQ
jgi:hypothetical protein